MTLQEKKKIKVTLQTKITIGSETEVYELVTFGEKFEKGLALYLQYTEEDENGKTKTMVKFKDQEALLMRNGTVKMRQLFVPDETTTGHYESIYGTLGMLTRTKAVEHRWNEVEKEGELNLRYDMKMQGSTLNKYEMTIAYKEEA